MKARKALVCGALALLVAPLLCADTRPNPYGQIVDRNPFGLKPPPPTVVEAPAEPAKPPPNVKLTGISNLSQKRALLEIQEQGTAKPGQAASGTTHRPILAENEAAFGVEVVSIDVEKSLVKIRNGGTESELTFEPLKASGPAGGGTAPPPTPNVRLPGSPVSQMQAQPQAAQQPTVVSSPNPQNSSGSGVTLFGGSAPTAGGQNNSGVTTLGGQAPAQGVPTPLGGPSGLRTIPSRTIRTPTDQQQPQGDVSPQMQAQPYRSNRTPPPFPASPPPPQDVPEPLPQQ